MLLIGEQMLSNAASHTSPNGLVMLAIVVGVFGQYLPENWPSRLEHFMSSIPPLLRGALAGTCVMLIEVAGPVGVAPFIYFQF